MPCLLAAPAPRVVNVGFVRACLHAYQIFRWLHMQACRPMRIRTRMQLHTTHIHSHDYTYRHAYTLSRTDTHAHTHARAHVHRHTHSYTHARTLLAEKSFRRYAHEAFVPRTGFDHGCFTVSADKYSKIGAYGQSKLANVLFT